MFFFPILAKPNERARRDVVTFDEKIEEKKVSNEKPQEAEEIDVRYGKSIVLCQFGVMSCR